MSEAIQWQWPQEESSNRLGRVVPRRIDKGNENHKWNRECAALHVIQGYYRQSEVEGVCVCV